jgi:hypothetical protein
MPFLDTTNLKVVERLPGWKRHDAAIDVLPAVC